MDSVYSRLYFDHVKVSVALLVFEQQSFKAANSVDFCCCLSVGVMFESVF